MRVFVTGATGYIGSAVVRELIDVGHEVVGLARTDAAAAALEAAGAEPQRGALGDLDALGSAAAAADGVVHTAFIHDFTDFAASAQTDLEAVQALGTALEGTDRPLVIASGFAGITTPGRTATETDAPDPAGGPRGRTEDALLAMADRGVRAVAVRLAPTVHGPHDHGFVRALVTAAREHGAASQVGDGTNRWPAVHRLDAAHLFRLALEGAPAGSRVHAAAEEGVPFADIAAAIGRQLGVPVRSVAPEAATEAMGFIGAVAGLDVPASSAATRRLLGWEPIHPGVVADIEAGHYLRD